uniref:Uncharacterized protein n=1 Tax=Bracon brevicornis TaxID=1563983 RepID=A0A6V7LE84_9HYME
MSQTVLGGVRAIVSKGVPRERRKALSRTLKTYPFEEKKKSFA